MVLGIVAVTVSLGGGVGQSFLISKRLPDILPVSGQGVLAQTGASSKGGGVVPGSWSQGPLTLRIYWGLSVCCSGCAGALLVLGLTILFFYLKLLGRS